MSSLPPAPRSLERPLQSQVGRGREVRGERAPGAEERQGDVGRDWEGGANRYGTQEEEKEASRWKPRGPRPGCAGKVQQAALRGGDRATRIPERAVTGSSQQHPPARALIWACSGHVDISAHANPTADPWGQVELGHCAPRTAAVLSCPGPFHWSDSITWLICGTRSGQGLRHTRKLTFQEPAEARKHPPRRRPGQRRAGAVKTTQHAV